MVMPSSGPISIAQAHAEFGLGYNINAYYGCDVGVPTSGAISLWHLYGKRKMPAFSFVKVYNIISTTGMTHNFSEFEFRNTIGGGDIMISCADCSPLDGGSGSSYNVGRPGFSDNNLNTFGGFTNGPGKFLIFQLNQKIAVREMAIYNYRITGGPVSFSVGGADSLAALQSGNGTLLGSFSNITGTDANTWRTFRF